jgi:hypothetical protein
VARHCRAELGSEDGLLTVVRQDLLAAAADLGPVRLQTAQNPQDVIRIDLQLRLAKPGHVRMAGDTLLIISLRHQRSDGRRLRRQLLRARSSNHQREHHRQDGYPHLIPPFWAFCPSNLAKESHIFLPLPSVWRRASTRTSEYQIERDIFASMSWKGRRRGAGQGRGRLAHSSSLVVSGRG